MSVEDCGNVALPSWSYSINTLDAEQQDANDPASRIAALLLAKLADYVVPGWCLSHSRSFWNSSNKNPLYFILEI